MADHIRCDGRSRPIVRVKARVPWHRLAVGVFPDNVATCQGLAMKGVIAPGGGSFPRNAIDGLKPPGRLAPTFWTVSARICARSFEPPRIAPPLWYIAVHIVR